MGSQQSSGRTEAPQGAAPTKTCYYELLSIDRQATDEEIKKAYRRKALELHPDRNIDNVAVATQKFAEVQSAYEVLSDPQERAWYDSHRDAILRGNTEFDDDAQPPTFQNVRLTPTEEIHNLISKFNASVPFDDEPTGFFGIARETFEHLALEEEAAADFDGIDCPTYPTFGSSGDGYESTVKPFYNGWASFTTRKSFSWKDKYRLSDAPDRRVRRLMEKENKKIRDEAAREFNEAVRFLVTFVRKRDPRYLPNTQTDSDRQKSMRDAAAAQAAKARAANQDRLATYETPSWAQPQEETTEEDHFPESEEESETEVLECVVCKKIFKSEKQLQVHEESKKHIKAVQKLRWQMRKEGTELNLEADRPVANGDPVHETTDTVEDTMATPDEGSGGEHNDRRNDNVDESPTGQDIADDTPTAPLSDDTLEDDDYAPRAAVQGRLAPEKSDSLGASTTDVDVDNDLSAVTERASLQDSQAKKKVGKAKAKREKRAAQSAQQTESHRCAVCEEDFTSRTKLFNHIRDEDHAAPVATKPARGKHDKKKRK